MSNSSRETYFECDLSEPCDAIDLILHPRNKELGGFSVRRSLPTLHTKTVGPWIFFDHMGPAHFQADTGINVRPHPHIGISTVTYLFEGEILHRDSLGSLQTITPGDLNLMVAGKGIVHSERERNVIKSVPHTVHGLQLWIALPTEHEEIEPAFYHYPKEKIPTIIIDDVPIRVLMGKAYNVTSPVKTFSETLYIEAQLQRGKTLTLPASKELGVYLVTGQLKIKDSLIQKHSMAILKKSSDVEIIAIEDSRIVVIGGATLGDRYIDWNIVSCQKERISKAREDWSNGHFSKIPGNEDEFIPLPK
jgi:redox-sensitive bicupin YhaK (pirin superfamily)